MPQPGGSVRHLRWSLRKPLERGGTPDAPRTGPGRRDEDTAVSAKGSAGAGTLSAAGFVAPQGWHMTEVSLAVLVVLMTWLVVSNARHA